MLVIPFDLTALFVSVTFNRVLDRTKHVRGSCHDVCGLDRFYGRMFL